MKNQNPVFIAIVFALAFALAPVTQAGPRPDGGPLPVSGVANHQPAPLPLPPPPTGPEDVELPAISIHSAGNILRGKTGSFVLEMKPAVMFGATYVNFSLGGTAIAGVDYVLLVSPAYIGPSGFGTILVQTLPDSRGSSFRQSYSVVVTLEPGAGYAVGAPRSATLWIK